MLIDITKKEKAIKFRSEGKSYREIERILHIPRSTLSGWLYNISLTNDQKNQLHQNWLDALVKARVKASQVHRANRLKRINKIDREAEKFITNVKMDKTLGELIFTTFYQAEGSKKENAVIIANSNPKMLKALIELFRYLYKPDESKFRCRLHLRADQIESKLVRYWSKLLSIPSNKFNKSQFDKRTIAETYQKYKGVCVVIYFDMNLQRRILYIGGKLIDKLVKIRARSSVG